MQVEIEEYKSECRSEKGLTVVQVGVQGRMQVEEGPMVVQVGVEEYRSETSSEKGQRWCRSRSKSVGRKRANGGSG